MYLLFDIGGTHTRFALSHDHQSISEVKIIDTPKNYFDVINTYKIVVTDLIKGEKITGMCGGVPGVLDDQKGVLVSAPHLPDWIQKPFKDEFQRALEAPLFLENDAALAGLGEAVYGAGQGKSIVAYLTVSTGVGGVRVVDGKIDKSAYNFEPGHQIVDLENMLQLEDLISGTALGNRYHQKPEEITDEQVWNEVAKHLAVGLHNTTVYWSPHIIVLGGSVSKSLPIEKAQEYFKEYAKLYPALPEVQKSKLIDISGLYGALASLISKAS